MSLEDKTFDLFQATPEKEVRQQLGALILAGGNSRRMGQAKASLEIQGQTFLERIVHTLAFLCDPVVVVGASDTLNPPKSWKCPAQAKWLSDQRFDEGPLHGITVGLDYLTGLVECCVVVGCDLPLLGAGHISRLIEYLSEADDTTDGVMIIDELERPALLSVWRTRILTRLDTKVKNGERKFQNMANWFDIKRIPIAAFRDFDPDLQGFWNINSPENYSSLLSKIREIG